MSEKNSKITLTINSGGEVTASYYIKDGDEDNFSQLLLMIERKHAITILNSIKKKALTDPKYDKVIMSLSEQYTLRSLPLITADSVFGDFH